jgi:AcrR family transcriptional regulator
MPRHYSSARRLAGMEDTRRRIVEATVALHSRQGALATTYAQIAARADVAVPTVYKHFPRQADLLAACTGHVLALSPPIGPEIFDGIASVEGRIDALVRAVFACHRFQAPWMRRGVHEAAVIPALGEILAKGRAAQRRLIQLALEPAFGASPPPGLRVLFESLLDFGAWQRLEAEAALGPRAEPQPASPESVTVAALAALLAAEGADRITRTKSPKHRSKRS